MSFVNIAFFSCANQTDRFVEQLLEIFCHRKTTVRFESLNIVYSIFEK